jgi:hypothetical protein
MVYGLHILKQNRNKPLAIALSGAGSGLRGRDDGGNVTNAKYKYNWNCHYESTLYKKYILIKILFKSFGRITKERVNYLLQDNMKY